MNLKKLYDPVNGQMQIAGFMSGSGSNLRRVLEREEELIKSSGQSPYHVAVIFTDNPESNAVKIGSDFDVPVVVRDIKSFYKKRGRPIKDMEVRGEFDSETVKDLVPYKCLVAAYLGYMRKASPILVAAFLGINVHPANMTILGEDGKPKYRGDHAVLDQLIAGEKELRSTTHVVYDEVDSARTVLMVSSPVKVKDKLPSDETRRKSMADDYQDLLKHKGDLIIVPKTLEDLALGKYAINQDTGILYHGGFPVPKGVRLD